MRITDVRTVLLTGPSTNDPYFGRTRRSAAFIEIITDTELTGLGAPTEQTANAIPLPSRLRLIGGPLEHLLAALL